MNRWGIMVDVSHPSKGAMMQAIGLSKAPVIASHSSVRKLANHSRNMDDEMLMAMKTNGGVDADGGALGLRQGGSSRTRAGDRGTAAGVRVCLQDAAAAPAGGRGAAAPAARAMPGGSGGRRETQRRLRPPRRRAAAVRPRVSTR